MIIDLFAGPGGWSEALKRRGLSELGIEFDKAACDTAEAAGHDRLLQDVRTVDLSHFPRVTGLIASPPCQTFSQAGKGAGRKALDDVLLGVKTLAAGHDMPDFEDERTGLVLEPLRWALELEPDWICLEQVPTVLPVWQAYADVLREDGYQVWTGNLHAEQYGVPQTRKRACLMARRGPVGPPAPTHSKYHSRDPMRLDPGVLCWVSMAEALGWGLTRRPAYTIAGAGTSGGGPRFMDGGAGTRREVRAAYDNGDWTGPAPAWVFNRPATTIVGSFKPEVVAAPGYRTTVSRQNAPESVTVTVAQAGVLQSFPEDYPWQGSRTKQFQQVGNAVPVLLADAVLSAVLDVG